MRMIHGGTRTSIVWHRIIMEDEAWLDEIQRLSDDNLDQWEHLTRTLDNPSFLNDSLLHQDTRATDGAPTSPTKNHHGMNRGTAMAQCHAAFENVSLPMGDAGDHRMDNDSSTAWPTAQASTAKSNRAANSEQSLQLSYSNTVHYLRDTTAALADTEPIPWQPPQQQQDDDKASMRHMPTLPHSPQTMLRHGSSSSSGHPPMPVVHPATDRHPARFESNHHGQSPVEPMPSDGTNATTTMTTTAHHQSVLTMGPPLTAYNYYFRNERDTIVRGMTRADDPVPASDEDYTPAKKAALLHQHWYVCVSWRQNKHGRSRLRVTFMLLL
jgi:hypothetical protein